MHWKNLYSIQYMTLMPVLTEIGTADHEEIGHLFTAMSDSLDLERLIFSYHEFAPHPFRKTECWG